MKVKLIALTLSSIVFMASAHAEGCVKGAVVGGVVGHVAGKHSVVGAGVGCLVGRHNAKKNKEKEDAAKLQAQQAQINQQSQTTSPTTVVNKK